ncbi:hypothetical protein LO772_16565 [Yinghuangia sp. ASG 101]|uniref:hypothetical protein n=1 Tax=Yinghuangia sp. ASG 101 TaxID=2896848 RepID=UPI001E325963|nr:hypothetical protein [Yinghuangia sp. ASG 101]UGQ15031.1 hypothetical protein LO772_16565 [Yinghuangia sp. ASG 101]
MPPGIDTKAAIAMTEADVRAILTDAQDTAHKATQALADAEANPASVTAARLAELRQEADHAALVVEDAARRQSEIRDIRAADERARLAVEVKTAGPADLDHADELLDCLTALGSALYAFVDAAADHNDRIDHWRVQAGNAGLDFGRDDNAITLGGRTRRHLDVPRILGSLTHRAMATRYPDRYRDGDDPYGRQRVGERSVPGFRPDDAPINYAELIRKDA